MVHTILLCADGSEHDGDTVRVASLLASRFHASIDLLNVLDPIVAAGPAAFSPEAGMSTEITLRCAQEGQESLLNRAAEVLSKEGIEFRARAELGNPLERILSSITEDKPDLVVIGSRGLNTISALLLGSISEGVAESALCPVLVVRGEPAAFRRIIIASDGSKKSIDAVMVGFEYASLLQARPIVLNVFEPFASYPELPREDLDPEVYQDQLLDAVTLQMEGASEKYGLSGEVIQRVGHPGEQLVAVADEKRADLIVVGTRGRSGLKRLIMGSVSSDVLHHAHCSILVVR